jgi:hypothetical protein
VLKSGFWISGYAPKKSDICEILAVIASIGLGPTPLTAAPGSDWVGGKTDVDIFIYVGSLKLLKVWFEFFEKQCHFFDLSLPIISRLSLLQPSVQLPTNSS